MEPLPNWLNTSHSGKARKAANDDGETERLKKRRREKHARRGMKEVERIRRYEESIRRKDKLVKKDKRRSEMANRDVTENYNNGRVAKNVKNCKPRRWQVGDGSGRELDILKRGKVEGNIKRKEGGKHRKFEESRKAVHTNVQTTSGKDRTREWVAEIMQRAKTSTERCLIGRSWAWYNVPQDEPESETSHQHSAGGEVDDITPSWPISRFCLDETPYFPIKKPFTVENIINTRTDIPKIGEVYSNNLENTTVNPITVTIKDSENTKKSFKSRIVSVFRYLSRRAGGKTL